MDKEFDSERVYSDTKRQKKKIIIHQDKKKSYGNKINTNFQAKKIAKENARFCY